MPPVLLSRVSFSSPRRCSYFQRSVFATCIDLLHSPDSHWQQTGPLEQKDIRLMVKHVFITSEFGSDRLPKWASWVQVIIDADDLPLNVSRETLQSSKFVKQMRSIILRHLLILLNKLATEDAEKWALVTKNYGMIFKFGIAEDSKNRDRLINLVRFESTQRKDITLDQVSRV
jgi:heat shock protein beta